MTALFYEGSPLLLQQSLFDELDEDDHYLASESQIALHRLSDSIRHAFATFDNQGALLVIEANIDEAQPVSLRACLLYTSPSPRD